ncbi:MAG: thioredoxin 1 [Bradymonadia bacterium]
MAVTEITDDTLEAEVLGSELPVLIDFYADWCGPCKRLAPILDQLSEEYDGTVKFVKVDVDKNPGTSQAFQVKSMPTMILMKDGQPVDGMVGAQPKAAIEEMLAKVASKPAPITGAKPFDAQKLKLTIEAEMAIPVDLRESQHYDRAHLPDAINIPREELSDRVSEMRAPGSVFVLYDRTDEGVAELATGLAADGVKAGFLSGGMLGWEGEMLPVVKP